MVEQALLTLPLDTDVPKRHDVAVLLLLPAHVVPLIHSLLGCFLLQVVFSLQLTCPAYDGAAGSGLKLLMGVPAAASKSSPSASAAEPFRAQLGSGQLPSGLEAALGSMAKGEEALFVIPAAHMQAEQTSSSSSGSQQQPGLSIPRLPAKCSQVEATVELLDLVQVGG